MTTPVPPDEPPPVLIRRRTIDVAVLGAAVAVCLLTAVLAHGGVTPFDRAGFELVNGLPDAIARPAQWVMFLGTLLAVPILSAIALAFRRVRIAAVMLASGSLAYALARLVKLLVDRGRPLEVLPHVEVIVRGPIQQGLGFPSGHAAVAGALAGAAIPYLAWRWRLWLLALPVLVALARIYVGAHLPLDVIGGLTVGAAVASAIHLALGRPAYGVIRLRGVPARPVTVAPSAGESESVRAAS
jgi:glycosyltransferase 2 family protein